MDAEAIGDQEESILIARLGLADVYRAVQESVRAAYEAMFSFEIEGPEYTTLGAVEMYTVGRRALETRDNVMEGLEALLAPGYELAPDIPPIAARRSAARSTR